MKIGLIGAGAIANFLLQEINHQDHMRITSVFVRNREKYSNLETEFGIELFTELSDFLDSNIDIVVEAAHVAAVKHLIPHVLQKRDTILISVGALVDRELLANITETATTYGRMIHLPSGAIGGLDLLQNAAALGTVTDVSLTTRKPAQSLIDQPLESEKIIFTGKAVDAIKQFPKNMNVSIVLSLAGLGIEKTAVTLIADPTIDKNIHHVNIKGDFGEASMTIKNNPLPSNPKTSYLAAMSILGTLNRLKQNVKIGS